MAKDYFSHLKARPLYTPTEQVSQQPASQQGRIGDLVDAGQAGLFSALGGMFDFVGAESLASSMYKNSDEQYTQMSERGREALSKSFVEEDDQGNVTLGDGATDLDSWLLTMANVAGQFAGTAVPGAGWASGAAKLASLGAKGKNVANVVGMGATGGAAATGQGMEQARQEVQNMPDTLLADSPLFGDVLRGVHASQPELSNVEKWEAAKTALANKVAQEVRTDPKVLIANFGASAIGDPIIGKALTGARLAKSGALRSALAGFVTEGSTEAVQAGVQQLGVNQSLQPIDNRDEMQGVVAAGLNEGLAGGGFGAAAGGIGGLVNRQPKQQTPQTEPTAEPAPQSAVDPVTEQMKASNPNLGEAMASMDQHSTNVKSEVDNLDIPTAARQAGFDTNAGAGQFGDFITSPSQESIQSMRNQSIADMINDAINNIDPTPDDRFSPIKYQHVGELLSPEQSTELQPAPRKNAQIDSGFIDGEMVPEQGLLPTQQQTQNRQAFERVQSEFNNQPAQIESKDIIFGEDGRPRQQAAERVKQAGKSAQNLLPQKDIIFAGNESGVNVARNGKPFKSMKEARNSKLARQAKRQGLTVDVVPFDNGYGWKVNAPATLTDEGTIPQSTESNIEVNAQPTANLAGDPISSEWTAFNEQSETKNIPRAEMPQIKAENRGAMVNFMNARDISHEQDEVPASSLKPTQQEFSPAKVKKAMEFEGGNRSILVSSDNYVLDGHHQWLAAREKGEPVKVIRLNAPIEQLVPLAKEMPSTETQDNAGNLTATGNEETATTGKLNGDNGKQSEQKGAETAETGKLIEQEPAANEQANQLPSILKTTKRKWLQSEAKKLGIKKGSPGYDAAIAKIEESYEPAIDKALAESSFETYQEFNSDTPESINRQAYSELRKEFGLDDQPIEKPQEQKTVQANDTESPNSSENKKVDDPVAAEPEANEQQSITNQATVKQESINDTASETEINDIANELEIETTDKSVKVFGDPEEIRAKLRASGIDFLGADIEGGLSFGKKQEQRIRAAIEGDNIELFSKSKKPSNGKSISIKQAQRVADQFIKGLKGANGIKISILQDTATAEKLWRMSLDGATVKGAYSKQSKTVYIIAENIDNLTDLKQTLAHETIAHGGLDTVIGKEAKQEFLNRIKATKGRKAFEGLWREVNKDYWDMSLDVKVEEMFARFVENEPSKGELKYWWNALKRWIKAQLDKAGIMYREDDELTAMRDMLESIVKGFKAQREPMVSSQAEMTYSQSDKKFSRTSDNDTRTAKEKLGLEEQARETIADRAKAKVDETVDTLKSSSFWQRLNEGIFDGLAGIKQAEVSAGVTDPNKQGYVSARLASGLADVLHGVFNYGAPVWKDGIIQRKENTKGLLEVFGMVGDDLNNWLAWMGANRAEKLKEQGRENNLTQADIDELKALANGKEELFEQVRQEYNKVNSAILDVAQGAGLLSEEQRASFDEEYYVPFFRDMGETDAEMDDIKRMIVEPHMRKGIASQSAKIKELKGGKQSTKDLLENIIARQSTLIDASLKNKAMQEVVNNLDGTDYMTHEKSEEAKNRTQEQLNNDGKVRVMVNGKPQAYLVSDPALLRALIQINDVGSQSLFNKMSRSAKRFLTAGITLSPDFIFKNFVRDAAHAWMINKDDFKFGTDSIKGLKKAFKEDEAYRDLIFSGAAFQGGYIHGADPEAAAQQTRRALRSKGLTTNEIDGYLDTIVNNGAELLEKYRGISDKVENANRLSTYEAALAAGKSKRQAAYEAKDLMDYSLKGNFKLIGTMIDMLPFFNARLQGMSKLVRAAKAGDGDRVLKVLSANLAMKGIKVAGFSLALAAMNDDDERYQELPDWDKDMNWHIFAGDQHFRIPKPFELGIIFGTLPERMLHTATGTQTGGDLGKAVANAVFNTLALNPIPQFALPATEVLVNKSFFKDAPIEGMADENKQAEDRYNTYTSEVAKGIGSTFGVSPKKVEHLIKGYTGTIGGYVLGASDIVARQIMGKETADTPVSRYPVIKAFYQGSGPKGSTKFANDFYESLEAANQAYGSYKRAMEEGDTSRQQELIEGEGDKLRSRIALGRVQRAASKLGKMARAVNDNPNLTGEQKRKQLDDIQRQKNALYHQAYVTFNLGEW